jgi:D-alanyl-D-alanine carboxypeptidase (penicillin-binding protein 5/6)
VPLVSDRDISLSVRRTARKDMTVTVEYTGPIPAPIVAGQPIAMLRVSVPDMEDRSFPLYAGADVGRLGPVGRITSALGHLIWGAGG